MTIPWLLSCHLQKDVSGEAKVLYALLGSLVVAVLDVMIISMLCR